MAKNTDKNTALTSPLAQVVVLTGNIGSGKSVVAGIFRELGAEVISADDLARRAVAAGSDGLREVIRAFGKEYLLPDGELNRKRLGELVFANEQKRRVLESVVHPLVQQLAEVELARALQSGVPLVVYECPLYFEAGLSSRGFGAVVLVTCDEEVALARVTARDGLTLAQVRARQKNQLPQAEKLAKADYVLDNSLTLAELRVKARELFEILKAATKPHSHR